jgi:hypothetical protein
MTNGGITKDLEHLAKNGTWEKIDISKITQDAINEPIHGVGAMKTNIIGIAAQYQKIDKFPNSLLSKKGLLTPNETGETPMHFICSKANHQLEHLANDIVNEETLLINNKDLTTPFHYLSFHGNLLDIDKKFLTQKNLELPNNHGLTPLDFSLFAINGEFAALPYPPKDRDKRFKKIACQINTIMGLLSDQFLKTQIKLPKDSKFYNEKSSILKAELARRSLRKKWKESSKCLEI